MRALPSLLLLLASSIGAVAPAAATPPVAADTPRGPTQRFQVGDAVVTALSDGAFTQDVHGLLLDITPAEIDRLLAARNLRNPVEIPVNAFLVEIGDRKVLVDAGAGAEFGQATGRLHDSLAAIGVRPETITDVLITHAHPDHIGGLARDGKPAFPNAVIHIGRHDTAPPARRAGDAEAFLKTYRRTVGLYPAQQVRPFTGSAEILPGVTATERPGHTPGTAFYTLTSKGQSVHFIGDTIHVGPVQFPRPSVTIEYDVDPATARQVRETAFADFAGKQALIAAPHLKFPGVGRLRANGNGGYAWSPADGQPHAPAHGHAHH